MTEYEIGIVAAVEPELEAVKQRMDHLQCRKIYELEFWSGTICNVSCLVVECGVGKVNAARAAQIMIDFYKISRIFNVGTAGGMDRRLKVGDIIISNHSVQFDYDRTALGNDLAHIPNLKSAYIASDPQLVEQCRMVMERLTDEACFENKIYAGTVVTGDIFKITDETCTRIKNNFNPLCIEMEGAAIAHVCELCNIPFVSVRSVSNAVTGSSMDEEEFWKFRAVAAERCALFITAYCRTIPEFEEEVLV